jgi:RHS repeat-associated protein
LTQQRYSNHSSFNLTERNSYGSSRLGRNSTIVDVYQTPPSSSIPYIAGKRYYELSNHLGNVLAVINDIKYPVEDNGYVDYFEAHLVSISDYSPFGVQLDERTVSSSSYRYGFNSMKKDDEVKGNGNSYTTEFRQYDSRLGRWLSLDPLMSKYPFFTPYSALNNNPLKFVDPDGLEGQDWVRGGKNGVGNWSWDSSINSEQEALNAGYDGYTDGITNNTYQSTIKGKKATVTLKPNANYDLSYNQEQEPEIYSSSPYDLNNNTQQYENMMNREITNFSQMRPFMVVTDGSLKEFNSRYDSKGMMVIARYTENFAVGAVMLSGGFVLGGGALLERGLSIGGDFVSQASFKGISEVNYTQTAGAGFGEFGGAAIGATLDFRTFSSDPNGRRLDWAINKDQGWGEIGINFATGWASGKVGGIKANSYSRFDRAVTIGGSSFLGQGVSHGIIEGPLKQ